MDHPDMFRASVLTLSVTDGGDMDSRDYVRMRYEKRMREGLEDRSGRDRPIGGFEKFTKVKSLCLSGWCCLCVGGLHAVHR